MLFDVERGREGINGFDFTKSAFERFDFSLNIAKLPSGSNLNFFFFFRKKRLARGSHMDITRFDFQTTPIAWTLGLNWLFSFVSRSSRIFSLFF